MLCTQVTAYSWTPEERSSQGIGSSGRKRPRVSPELQWAEGPPVLRTFKFKFNNHSMLAKTKPGFTVFLRKFWVPEAGV